MHAAEPTVTSLEAAWPIFGLRIRSERLVLRLPTDDDMLALMDLAKAGIHPPDEMPFAPGRSANPRSSSAASCPTTGMGGPHGRSTIGG